MEEGIAPRKHTARWWVSGILLVIILVTAYSFYIGNLESFIDDQDTLILGQDTLMPGSEAGVRIVTLNHKDGEPIPDAKVEIEAKNVETGVTQTLYAGKTDHRGTGDIVFDVPAEMEGDYELIIKTSSKAGKDRIITPITLEKPYRLLLTTDKPLYQPGQTIHIRSLALEEPSGAAASEEVLIEVEDPKGNKVFKKRLEPSDYGIGAIDFTLASDINLGRYTVRASIGDYETEKKIEVKRYVLPKFKIGIETDRTYYLPGQRLEGTVTADYFFGKPTNDAEIIVKLYAYEVFMEELGEVKGRTNAAGVFSFDFILPDHFIGLPLEKGSSLLFFNVSVTDQAAHTESKTGSVPVAEDPILIELIPESGALVPNVENILYIVTTYPDGRPAQAKVQLDGKMRETNAHGIGTATITPTSSRLTIEAKAIDDQGNRGAMNIRFPREYIDDPQNMEEVRRNRRMMDDGGKSESILLRVDRSIIDVGESIHLDILSTSKVGTVYLDAVKDGQTMLTKAIDLHDGLASLDWDADASMAGTIELHAYKILRDSNIVRDTRTVFVNHARDIDLAIASDKDSYLPGEEATISFTTTKGGRGVQSAIGVNIVDESVFALQESLAGFERLYFELEQEFMQPRSMIYGVTLPKLIYDDVMMDQVTKAEAGNILMAMAPETERHSVKVFSQEKKKAEIEERKARYFDRLFTALAWLLILIPLVAGGKLLYDRRHEKMGVLKDFGWSALLAFGAWMAVGALFFFYMMLDGLMSYRTMNKFQPWIAGILALGLVVAVILALRSRREHYWRFLISGSLVPVLLFLLVIPTAMVFENEYLIILFFLLFLGLIIASLIALLIHSFRQDRPLFWTLLLTVLYVIVGPISFIGAAFMDTEPEVSLILLFLSSLIIPFIYLIGSIGLIRQRSRTAVPAIIIGLLLLTVPFMGVAYFGVMSPNKFLARPMMLMDVGMVGEGDWQRVPMAAEATGAVSLSGGEPPRIRQFFPETLYSNPAVITDPGGKGSITLDVADSITTWRITALANTKAGELGSNDEGMVVFQDFFVDIDLPRTLTQGDEVEIPIAIYNYLDTGQRVRLEMQEESWFELLDAPSKTVELGPNDIDVAHYRIKAKRLGEHRLTVMAYGSSKSDAIARSIEIAPDGKEFRVSHSDRLEGTVERVISIPEAAIPDSERLFIKIYPGLFSQVVEGLDSMFRMPNGCFEQTSTITYPNILTLSYMKETKQITPEIQFKAEEYIGTGYQRLLTFESNTKGGWTWFGPPEEANLLLSTYGLMEFYDMGQVYEIDERIIERTQGYLKSQMKGDGSFEPEGRLHTQGLQIKEDGKMAATCFVAWSLAYSGEDIGASARFIRENIDLEKVDSYSLAMCANAMAHHDKKKALSLLQELDERAVKDGKTVHWESGAEQSRTMYGGHGQMKGIETTALAALAYIEAGYGGSDTNKILTYLVNEKDSHGTWGSTFATIMSLKALIKGITGGGTDSDATIDISIDGVPAGSVRVTPDNSDVLQLVELKSHAKPGDTTVKLAMRGEGNIFYQIVGAYHVGWKGLGPLPMEPISIWVEYDRKELRVEDTVTVNVEAVYNGLGTVDNAIIDLGIPPGFSVRSEDLQRYVASGLVERYDITGRQIILYLRDMGKEPVLLEYRLEAKYPIKAKTPSSRVYDYYNPDVEDEVEPIELTVI